VFTPEFGEAAIAYAATAGDTVLLAPVVITPIAAVDVATAVARIAAGSPIGGVLEVSGPEEFRLTELIARGLAARGDARQVVDDPEARYFGAHLSDRELIPGRDAEVFPTTFAQWLDAQAVTTP
jgi:uncharacterized protein YbjT (DUF2867 family)